MIHIIDGKNMNYKVRKLEKEDLEILSILMQESFINKPWNENWKKEVCFKRLELFNNIPFAYNLVLIDDENKICGASIGYIVPFLDDNEYDLQEFFIDTKRMNQHLGTILMNKLIEKLKENKVTKIKFYTYFDLCKFYSRFGYEKSNNEYLMEMKI